MTDPEHPSDGELLRRMHAGDRVAFGLLYERYRQPLFAYCLRLVQDSDRAEDTVHETFMQIFKSAHTLSHDGAARSWIFRIAHNEALMLLRRTRQTVEPDPECLWEKETPLSRLEQEEDIALVQRFLNSLRLEYREVLQLREYEQLSYADIAGITGDTESSVKSRIFKARQALARALAPWYGERHTS
jgi:RNA polymerase sigma-70 factor, ECF subfamily